MISYSLPKREFVSLKIYDVLGREVANLVNGEEVPGIHTVNFNGSSLASGVYFYSLKAGGYNAVKKMMLLK